MVKSWEKLVLKTIKSGSRKDLAKKLEDIENGVNLQNYDIKPLEGFENFFRVRVGDFRIIFEKNDNGNKIIKINKRGDVYKK